MAGSGRRRKREGNGSGEGNREWEGRDGKEGKGRWDEGKGTRKNEGGGEEQVNRNQVRVGGERRGGGVRRRCNKVDLMDTEKGRVSYIPVIPPSYLAIGWILKCSDTREKTRHLRSCTR